MNFDQLLTKIKALQKTGNFDLSREEDLSIAIMNLVSLEEHFFFTAQKTGKDEYLGMMGQIRETRKELMGKMIEEYEGEAWCICKHLLAATMRLIEVGTKYQTEGKDREAKVMFNHAYKIYNLFWAVRLKLINLKGVKQLAEKKPMTIDDLVNKLVDCCKE